MSHIQTLRLVREETLSLLHDTLLSADEDPDTEDIKDLREELEALSGEPPFPCVIVGGDERVGKSRTIGCILNHLLERPVDADTVAVTDGINLEYSFEEAGEATASYENANKQRPLFATDPAAARVQVDEEPFDDEQGEVDWTITANDDSCTKIPVTYTLATDASEVEVRVQYQTLEHVEKRYQQFLALHANEEFSDDTPGVDDCISANALTEEVCAMAGLQNNEENADDIACNGLLLPPSVRSQLGRVGKLKLGPLVPSSGQAARRQLVRLMAGNFGLYKDIDVRIPAKINLKLIDTAGLAAMASLGFMRTVEVLKDCTYAAVMIMQADGKAKSDLLRALHKAGLFARFSNSLTPPPYLFTIRNYGREKLNLAKANSADAAFAAFKRDIDDIADYKHSMQSMLDRLRPEASAAVLQRHQACGLFNYQKDIPADMRECKALHDEFSLSSLVEKLKVSVDDWNEQWLQARIKVLLERVLIPLSGLLLGVRDCEEQHVDEVAEGQLAAQPLAQQFAMQLADPARTAIAKMEGELLADAQRVRDEYLLRLGNLAAQCTPAAAKYRLENNPQFSIYAKVPGARRAGHKLGAHLGMDDLTTTLLPQYLVEPLLDGVQDLCDALVKMQRQVADAIQAMQRELHLSLQPEGRLHFLQNRQNACLGKVVLAKFDACCAQVKTAMCDQFERWRDQLLMTEGGHGARPETLIHALDYAMRKGSEEDPETSFVHIHSIYHNDKRNERLQKAAPIYAKRLVTALDAAVSGNPHGMLPLIIKQRLPGALQKALQATQDFLLGLLDSTGDVDIMKLDSNPLFLMAMESGLACHQHLQKLQEQGMLCGASIPDRLARELLTSRPTDDDHDAMLGTRIGMEFDPGAALQSLPSSGPSPADKCFVCEAMKGELVGFMKLRSRIPLFIKQEYLAAWHQEEPGTALCFSCYKKIRELKKIDALTCSTLLVLRDARAKAKETNKQARKQGQGDVPNTQPVKRARRS